MAVTTRNMVIKRRRVLTKFPFIPSAHFIDIDQSNSINGVTYGSPATVSSTLDAVNNRWHNCKFSDASSESACVLLILPKNYIAGTNITIDLVWSSDTSTSGNCYWDFGLQQTNGSDVFTDADGDAEFIGQTAIAGPTATNEVITTSNTFDGTGLVAGDVVSFMFMREGGDVLDTLSGDVYAIGIYPNYFTEQL